MKKKDLLIPIVMLAIGAGVGFLARDRSQPQPTSSHLTVAGDVADGSNQAAAPTQKTDSEPKATTNTPDRYPTFADDNLDALARYKGVAERIMRAAAAAGSVEAALQLAHAYQGTRGPWASLLQPERADHAR